MISLFLNFQFKRVGEKKINTDFRHPWSIMLRQTYQIVYIKFGMFTRCLLMKNLSLMKNGIRERSLPLMKLLMVAV